MGNLAPLAALNTNGGTVTFNANAIATQMTIRASMIVTEPTAGMISTTLPFAGYDGPASLTLIGRSGEGSFGADAPWQMTALRVDVPGLFVVTPNGSRAMSPVWLRGDPAKVPFYEFYTDTSRREVIYNGRRGDIGGGGDPAPRSQDTTDALRLEQQRNASELAEREGAPAGQFLSAEVERETARQPELCTAVSSDPASALACERPQAR